MSPLPAARVVAIRVLDQVLGRGRTLDEAYHHAHTGDLDPRDQALVKQLCFGTLRWHPRLEALAALLLRKPLKAKDHDLYCTLLIGLYQLAYLRLPAHAAIHATVEVVGALKKPWARGLVNGVLRRMQRESTALLEKLDRDPVASSAHPRWLLDAITTAYPKQWPTIVSANNSRAPMTLRVNQRRQARDDYLSTLTTAGIDAHPSEYADTAVTLSTPRPTQQLPGFDTGLVSVQDAAAQLCAGLLDLQPGQRVLDACAAPGGKTGHILEAEAGLRELVALDRVGARLERLRDNLKRLQLDASVIDGDALHPDDWWDGQPFDRILVDAPCSGTGVIRRHPDIKTLRRASDIAPLASRQQEMLAALWPLLASRGILVYVTCSILPQENDRVASHFLATTPDARESAIPAAWGRAVTVGRQILPGDADMDGFFFARFCKG